MIKWSRGRKVKRLLTPRWTYQWTVSMPYWKTIVRRKKMKWLLIPTHQKLAQQWTIPMPYWKTIVGGMKWLLTPTLQRLTWQWTSCMLKCRKKRRHVFFSRSQNQCTLYPTNPSLHKSQQSPTYSWRTSKHHNHHKHHSVYHIVMQSIKTES